MVKPKLLDEIRYALRTRHLSPRTEQGCINWMRNFILFHKKRHPAEMDESDVSHFLTHLATNKNVALSTQNQALSAVLSVYRDVIKKQIGWIDRVERAKKTTKVTSGFFKRRNQKDLTPFRRDKMDYGNPLIWIGSSIA